MDRVPAATVPVARVSVFDCFLYFQHANTAPKSEIYSRSQLNEFDTKLWRERAAFQNLIYAHNRPFLGEFYFGTEILLVLAIKNSFLSAILLHFCLIGT